MRARLQGVVILESVIDREGRVGQVRILKGLPMGLSEKAVEAVRKWRFKPALLDGKPVPVFYNLTVNFELDPASRVFPAEPFASFEASPLGSEGNRSPPVVGGLWMLLGYLIGGAAFAVFSVLVLRGILVLAVWLGLAPALGEFGARVAEGFAERRRIDGQDEE